MNRWIEGWMKAIHHKNNCGSTNIHKIYPRRLGFTKYVNDNTKQNTFSKHLKIMLILGNSLNRQVMSVKKLL